MRAVSGVLKCSIVIAELWPDANRAGLGRRRDAPAARGLISISKESWPQEEGSAAMRAVISIEADTTSIRWYAREVLLLDEDHPSWLDMERQIFSADGADGDHAPRRVTPTR